MAEERCTAGQWVEVERVLLEPSDRAANLPQDTAAQPLRVWVKGFASDGAAIGAECEIETMTGRTVRGALSAINPGYTHTFGSPPPGIVSIGRDLRMRLADYRAGTGATSFAADAADAGIGE
jgi:hypothetical protein